MVTPDAGPPDPFDPQVLGPISFDEAGSSALELEIPPGLGSFTVVLEAPSDDDARRLVVLSLETPDGRRLLDWNAPADAPPDLNPASIPYPGVTTVLVPGTDEPEAAPVPGTWSLRVGLLETDFVDFTPVAGTIDRITVVFEPADELGGALDLNLFLAPGTGLTSSVAPDDPWMAEMLGAFAGYFSGPGIAELGQVGYVDLPEIFDRIDGGRAAREMVAELARPGARGHAINVFVVDDLSFAAGFTGAIPGPPGRFDSAASGVVVERLGNAGRMGTLLAHEVGHFVGLRHTTELDTDPDTGGLRVAGADPISDTPSCPSGTEISDCPDYRNLMFPIFPFDGLSLTPGQVAVLRGSPWLVE